MNEANKQKIVDLDRGLFLVNYKSAEDPEAAPRVAVAPYPGHEKHMELVLHPDAQEAMLWEPNTSLVVRVTSPGKLQVQVLPRFPGSSRAAVVRIEPVNFGGISGAVQQKDRGVLQPRNDAPVVAMHASPAGFKLLGHVAGIGDVNVGLDEWIAGPSAPSRIEGISLDWSGRPANVNIRYAVQFANAQPGSGRMVPLGQFAGTRGRALPLTGVVLEMDGPGNLEFIAEAIFLGAPTLRAIGRRVVLSGPTGREPLVGLRINLEGISAAAEPPPPSEETRAPNKKASDAPGSRKIRVFRARPKPQSSVG
jgi:hypothetical protein